MQLTAPEVMSTDTAVISITDCDFVYCSPQMNPRATGGNLKTVKFQKEFRANPMKEAKEKESAKLKAKIMTEESDDEVMQVTTADDQVNSTSTSTCVVESVENLKYQQIHHEMMIADDFIIVERDVVSCSCNYLSGSDILLSGKIDCIVKDVQQDLIVDVDVEEDSAEYVIIDVVEMVEEQEEAKEMEMENASDSINLNIILNDEKSLAEAEMTLTKSSSYLPSLSLSSSPLSSSSLSSSSSSSSSPSSSSPSSSSSSSLSVTPTHGTSTRHYLPCSDYLWDSIRQAYYPAAHLLYPHLHKVRATSGSPSNEITSTSSFYSQDSSGNFIKYEGNMMFTGCTDYITHPKYVL